MSISENLAAIRKTIPPHVTLVAVSKTVEEARLREALNAGQRVFGENYMQEAKAKWPALKAEFPDIKLHCIGHLQSNKADEAVKLFDRIDTLDRISLVQALSKAMKKHNRNLPCLIEVNIGDEPQKAGCAIADVSALLEQCTAHSIEVLGMMCIPPEGGNPELYFQKLTALAKHHDKKIISMGMSSDYREAITCGSTEIRIGTGIFGKR